MEQLKILLYVLATFFGIENGQFVAEKTTVTISPQNKEIKIIQENLFTIIQSENDKILALENWNKLIEAKEGKISWSKELEHFPIKEIHFTCINSTVQPHLTLCYSKEKDLQALGIWYDSEKNQFAINYNPQLNIKTKNGKLTNNYWYFNGDNTFSFTIEPFWQMPEKYQKLKVSLKQLLVENGKK